jgi:hypothetical protein
MANLLSASSNQGARSATVVIDPLVSSLFLSGFEAESAGARGRRWNPRLLQLYLAWGAEVAVSTLLYYWLREKHVYTRINLFHILTSLLKTNFTIKYYYKVISKCFI